MPTRNNKESVRESTNIVNPFIIREVVPNKTKKVTKKQPVRAPELKENYRVSDRIKESKGDVAELRNEEAQKYTIPYIPEKEIRLTTGRYNTGKISTNILDSIYNAAIRTGVPVDIALGLAGRESTLGIGRGFKRGQSITGTDLMSNWQQIDPYTIKNSVIKGYNDVAKKYNNNAPLTKEEADKMIKFFEENDKAVGYLRTMDENPIDNALKYYMSGKYNPGDKRHTQMVEEDAKVLMSDPAIQKWYQSKINTQMKCGGRRKAQLGLDIREGGIAIPIAPNMYYMNGRSHDDGGIAIGPNNKNGLEVEGGEVVEMIDSNHPSVGRQFKAGGQQQTMRVFSSVPFLRGASPAELVMGGANPDVVFKAQEEFKDRNRINDDGTMYKTGGIYIKASKRGTFTAAATKHGMGVQEFASKVLANKEDYSSAMVKKANFARNASRWKKEYGGSMLYTINGNVKNGLMSARPKAQYGKQTIIRNNKEWEYDEKSGGYIPVKNVTKYKTIADKTYKKEPDSKNYVEVTDSIEKIKVNQPKKQIVKQNKNSTNKLIPINENKYTSVTKPNTGEYYVINPLTGEWIRNGVTETSEPSVKGTTKVTSKSSSTSRGSENQSSKATASVKPSTVEQPAVVRRDEYYSNPRVEGPATPVDETYAARQARGAQAVTEYKTDTNNTTDNKNNDTEGKWIGQYKTTNAGDWIGLGSNLLGSILSYGLTNSAISKTPMPARPAVMQAAKLKTTYNVEPQLSEIREAEQMNRAAVRRNTASSNTSLAREQRLLNEARGARGTLYGQKENIETQLINQDRLNRQQVGAQNTALYNDYLNRVVGTKQAQNQYRISNVNNLLSGLTGSVNNILGTIESRRATNNTLRAIAAANPNVDARLIGGFDYYIDPVTKKMYNKNQQYVRTING